MNFEGEKGRDRLNIFSDTELCISTEILVTLAYHASVYRKDSWGLKSWYLLEVLSVVHGYFMKTVGIFPHNVEVTSHHRRNLLAVLLAHQNCPLT